MFRSSSSSAPSYSDAFLHRPASFSAALPTVPTQIPRGGYFDGNGGGSFPPFAAASSPPSYSSSLPSSYYIHRSISSHSLPLHLQLPDPLGANAFFSPTSPSPHQLPLPPLSSSPSSSSGEFFEFSSGPVRRVYSTGDLQGMNGSSPPPPPSGDSYGQEGGGPFSQKVGRYSAEERKERIERYRIKRHQRNFNKKITYACRKTLADSRPRVKGRFARNGEAEAEAEADTELEREGSDASYEYFSYNALSNSSGCYYGHKDSSNGAAFGGGGDDGEWWRRAPVGAAAPPDKAEQVLGFDDDDLWASLADVLSVNLTS